MAVGALFGLEDRFAARGWLAVAPSTFHRVQPNVELGYTSDDMQAGMGLKAAVEALPAPGVMPDIQAAIDYAAAQSGRKVGIVGFCWGGLLTWRAACTLSGLSAAVPYYGGGMTSSEEAARHPKVPVLAHFGQRDHYIPVDSVQAFAADPLVEATLGSTLRQEFITYKEQEWSDYHLRVSQWEVDQYARLY